ncbi:MOSC domain-containing protein [Candidatus Lucifugimonas marina]|uniref:MOSC domain-containing protein n=1 Tax=Candidatus Lucifugimonas marina TaxID=3038979 RepID=A0AAJ6CSB3_9CHLR|nr:MOSC domain-containing protein [SAR202 cluster bacterium JH702]MDG0869419.1 MOSC domain-containing protein [SAR202 cluster bacterium JH639]WFG34165.1 MOSC domain-containing protein [SAR202 cluster bacterium JH545]WFG38092.1 MOSC domain-containing protein [SAR202 cluster bacterium JH1073]
MKVIELYRHPVKSFTPERLDQLHVVEGKIRGDRVLAFRFADQGAPDDWSWRRKINFVALSNTPGIPQLELSFDDDSRVLTLKYENEMFAEGSVDSEEDRFDLSEAVGEFVTALEVNPLIGHPERVPLNLIGDGRQGLFHDFEDGGVTLHSVESLKALESHMSTTLDGRRFRTNVVVGGVEAWEELSWTGRISIGDSAYKVNRLVPRCLATHANPVNGERDLDIMKSLMSANGYEEPTFAVQLSPFDTQAVIRVGDSVTVG